MDKFNFTRKEAANYIGISLSKFATIQNQIPRFEFDGIIRFRKEDIDNWITSKIKVTSK